MENLVMTFGVGIFFVLFALLSFLFIIFIASKFRRREYPKYKPTVTLVIPAYNEEKVIEECLTHVYATKYPKLNVILIDDGSTDRTVAIAKKFPLTLLTQQHKGKVAALNKGLAKATGEVLVTIDADTLVETEFIHEIVKPFADENVGATSGAVLVKNKHGLAGMFQNIEYHYNNLIRQSFSETFNTGIWFFGCLAAYRTDTLKRIGGFKRDTLAEDMDIAMECKLHGYKTINVPTARGHTYVPTTFKKLFLQRSRWWVGGLQSLKKHKQLFHWKQNPSIHFLFINHFWWAAYAFISLPLILYQVYYWMPATQEIPLYLFRWFTFVGPFYVLMKIPEWGVNLYNIFGVLSGIISLIMIISAVSLYKDKLTLKSGIAIFLYFPYTIILNVIVAGSVIRACTLKQQYFIE